MEHADIRIKTHGCYEIVAINSLMLIARAHINPTDEERFSKKTKSPKNQNLLLS